MDFRYAYLQLTLAKVKVKVIHISTVSILEVVRDKEKITNAITLRVMYELSFNIFTFDLANSKG